jgi:hypothetical protein
MVFPIKMIVPIEYFYPPYYQVFLGKGPFVDFLKKNISICCDFFNELRHIVKINIGGYQKWTKL